MPPTTSPLARAAVPVAVYAVIIGLSSIPAAHLQGPEWGAPVAHLLEYGALGATLTWARGPGATPWWWAVPVGLLLAVVDETYQATFVAGRVGEVADIVVDAFALTIGAALVRAGGDAQR